MENKKYFVLDGYGNPIEREGSQEVNPFVYYSLISACVMAEKEKKNHDAVEVIEIKSIERQGSGM